ncbi:MAG: hypothetical protein MUF83_18390 [Acidimicrobiales bacterium]|nr:hypothetical protein [Acidimicrobiales bacterium]
MLSPVTVLIPAAGSVPDSVLALSNVSSPAMIPVAGRPVVHWTLDYLASLGVQRVRLAVAKPGLFVEEYVTCVFGERLDVEVVVPDADRGVGYTLAGLAEGVEDGPVLVVLGDTHFELADPAVLDGDVPVVLVDEVDESYRWCVVDLDEHGAVVDLHDKQPGLEPPLQALVGVYFFPDVAVLQRACRQALATSPGRVELAGILRAVQAEVGLRGERAGRWLDCGNPDRQSAAQRVLLSERAFNLVEVDPVFGTLTKRSRHVEKFIDEINYLRLVPPDLAVLFPRLLDYSVEWDEPFARMEFYGYPTLAELFVFENVDPGIWHRVFEHLHELVVDGFLAHPHPVPPADVAEMYLGKVRRRLAEVAGPPALRGLIEAPGVVELNGREVPNLPLVWSRLEAEVDRLARTSMGSVIHGDLCFSNVLYDLRSGICKLIDPRGSFGRVGITGDVRYDVAKLYHSVHGLYDVITADLFQVDVVGTKAEFTLHTRPLHDAVRDVFDQVFFERFDRRDVLLVAGLVLVSLPPLHFDRPERQLALYLRGLELLDEALRSPGPS